ncbi:integrase core domain-containing protein [Myxococcus sp. MxC21-1]|uniref:integrase core domain-containing protein n=1 Tax=Myxococcus sp. MxC21-1 TaxID=3041439 RepID=UPI00397794AC
MRHRSRGYWEGRAARLGDEVFSYVRASTRSRCSGRIWGGFTPSFSRPRVSDDNAFSEALFRTLKYRPSFPQRPFASAKDAHVWVARFVGWYNTEHRHPAIRFVTPGDRHCRREAALLARRHQVYQRAKSRHPERCSLDTRDWTPAGPDRLGPSLNRTPAVQELKRFG